MTFQQLLVVGQCNVKTRDGGEQIAYDAEREELYKNEDLENGLFTVLGGNTLFFNKTDKELHTSHVIRIYVGTLGGKKEIIPRQLTITFSNNSSITLTADNISDPQLIGRVRLIACGFRLTYKETMSIIDYDIKSMTITDNRTEQSFRFQPYSKIFKEQFECIVVKAKG